MARGINEWKVYIYLIYAMERNATFENIFAMNKLPEGALYPPHQFIHYSAHYPTILGLFSHCNCLKKIAF